MHAGRAAEDLEEPRAQGTAQVRADLVRVRLRVRVEGEGEGEGEGERVRVRVRAS